MHRLQKAPLIKNSLLQCNRLYLGDGEGLKGSATR